MATTPIAHPAKRSTPRTKRDAPAMFLEAIMTISKGAYKNNARDMVIEAQHVQSFATLQAAALIATAIDRNTAAIKARAKTNAL